MPLVTRENVELARVGDWNASTGRWNCTRAQLADAVRAHRSGKFRSPIIARGHKDPRFAGDRRINEDGEPALGQVKNLRLAADGDSLRGDVLVPDWLDDELPALYPSRSIEADLGVETADGDSFAMVMTGLSLLGVTKPAIQPLEELAASEGEPVEFIAATSVAASMVDPVAPEAVEAAAWNEALHPRGGTGTATGGQFVSQGSGYSSKGKNKADQAQTVKDVQAELVRLGLLDPSSGKHGGIDGLFGPKTETAVKAWQTAHGHLATGRVTKSLLKTLQDAKKTAPKTHPMPNHSVTPSKTAPDHANATRVRHSKVKAAAEELINGLDLEVQQVGDGFVACGDSAGRTWVAKWTAENGDENPEIGELAPATVTYAPLANSVSAGAAHNMARPAVHWPRDWEVRASSTSRVGEPSVDITQLREALGLDDEADEAAALASIAELKSKADASEIPPTEEPTPILPIVENEIPADATAGLDALVAEKVAAAIGPIQASHQAIQAANQALVAEVGTLSSELADRKKAEAAAHKGHVLASALEQGKIAPADRESWSKRYDQAPAVIEEILGARAPGTEFTVAASGYAGSGELTSTDDDILRSLGLGSLVGGDAR